MVNLRVRARRRPEDYVSNRNISNIFEEVPVLDKLMFVVVGARDFSPEITVLPIGTEVPCSDRVSPQSPIYRAQYSNYAVDGEALALLFLGYR